MVKRAALGRGMAALLPVVEEEGKSYFSCPIEKVKPNKNQPRKTFTPAKLEELADSIREKGIIQPLVVRAKGDHYELVAGERRWRAAQKAGLHEVPVVIQNVSDDVAMEMALIENIQREDLNAVEEAEAYHALIETFTLSQEELAKRVGKDRSTITNFLRLLKLPQELKRDIVEERLSMGHARALLALHDDGQMKQARGEIIGRHLSVRETERLVKRMKEGPKPARRQAPAVEMADLVDRLKRHFKAKVTIREKAGKGRIEISFSSVDDLARIIDAFTI